MKNVIVVAPHFDDETLGCGGLLLKEKRDGHHIHLLVIATMVKGQVYSTERVNDREIEIQAVVSRYAFDSVNRLNYQTAYLDQVPTAELIKKIADIFHKVNPTDVYLPFRRDAHSDHRIVFDAGMACTKWFRQKSIRRVLAYETLSETHFNLDPQAHFKPSVYCDISDYIDQKAEIMQFYKGEREFRAHTSIGKP